MIIDPETDTLLQWHSKEARALKVHLDKVRDKKYVKYIFITPREVFKKHYFN